MIRAYTRHSPLHQIKVNLKIDQKSVLDEDLANDYFAADCLNKKKDDT